MPAMLSGVLSKTQCARAALLSGGGKKRLNPLTAHFSKAVELARSSLKQVCPGSSTSPDRSVPGTMRYRFDRQATALVQEAPRRAMPYSSRSIQRMLCRRDRHKNIRLTTSIRGGRSGNSTWIEKPAITPCRGAERSASKLRWAASSNQRSRFHSPRQATSDQNPPLSRGGNFLY